MADPSNTIPEEKQEEWRPVPGYEDYYSVSSQGRVRRDAPGNGTQKGRILRPILNGGYHYITLHRPDRPRKRCQLHRIVMEAFCGTPPLHCEVNHRDGVKTNNALSNLEYVTHGENVHHAYVHGLNPRSKRKENYLRGSKHLQAKATESIVLEIRSLHATGNYTYQRLADLTGLSARTVWRIVKRQNWKHI